VIGLVGFRVQKKKKKRVNGRGEGGTSGMQREFKKGALKYAVSYYYRLFVQV
jgi:hypothetical protein